MITPHPTHALHSLTPSLAARQPPAIIASHRRRRIDRERSADEEEEAGLLIDGVDGGERPAGGAMEAHHVVGQDGPAVLVPK